jgi:hypothetical protein
MGPSQKLLWKLYVGVLGAVTTIVAQRLVSKAWQVATGNEPPTPTDPETPAVQAVTWALASGIGVGAVQLVTTRLAAKHWRKEMGTATPNAGKLKLII